MQSQTPFIHVRRRSGRRMIGVGASRNTLLSLLVAGSIAVATLTAPFPARAASVISNVRIASVTGSGFVVTLNSLGAGWRYRVYASTVRSQIYYDVLSRAPYRSGYATAPRIGISGIPYTAKPVWYRVQAEKGTGRRTSEIFQVGLRSTAPTGLEATSVKGSIALRWGGQAAGGAQVQHATDAAFTTGVKTYGVRGSGRQLTPYWLRAGTTYWFRVRSLNVTTPSGWSPVISARPSGRTQDIRTMTYNILTLAGDGTRAAGGTISPWSARRPGAVEHINTVKPDVIAVQEGAAWVGATRGDRQVDDLVKALGGAYGLATTEVPPSQPGYFRTSSYVLYKKASHEPVGAGGHWNIGDIPGGSRWGAYQVLRHRTTGAQLLFVSTHFYAGAGATADRLRYEEAQSLLAQSKRYAASRGGLPIVYGGDFNSHSKHALDGPAVAMNAAGFADGFWVSQTLSNTQYNSANQYFRTPVATGDNVDHVYASPGVAMRVWRQLLKLSGGAFVGTIPSDHNPVMADLTIPY